MVELPRSVKLEKRNGNQCLTLLSALLIKMLSFSISRILLVLVFLNMEEKAPHDLSNSMMQAHNRSPFL